MERIASSVTGTAEAVPVWIGVCGSIYCCGFASSALGDRRRGAAFGQRKIRVLPLDQDDGGGKFHDDREANEPDETRILTHQCFGANEDRDMDRRDGEHGRRYRRRSAAARGGDV